MKVLSSSLLLIGSCLHAAASPTLDQPLAVRGEEHPFIYQQTNPSPVLLHDQVINPSGLEFTTAAYESGEVHMSLMMTMSQTVEKLRTNPPWADDPTLEPEPISEYTPCVDGYANIFSCKNLDLHAFVPHAHMGNLSTVGSDIWGWTHEESGREFGLVGQFNGTAFVEILEDGSVLYIGQLPTQSDGSIWRDIKVIGHHAYIGSEAIGHGVQVFDLTKLLNRDLVASPQTFSLTKDLAAHYDRLPAGASHNIVAHESKNLIIAVGSVPRNDSCASGLIFIDVSDPTSPKNAGCASQDGYVHDAQCLTYHGPHTAYEGRDICYSFNEDSFTIYDITVPTKPVVISRIGYYGVAYSHQGWVIDETDQRYLLLDDELDEMQKTGWANDTRTTTYIWDIQNLTAPVLTGHYKSPAKAIDHNLYVHEGLAYESNYGSGLRVVDVRSVYDDPTGKDFKEVAFFDVHPEDDDVGGIAEFCGSWSTYPYFKSGYILINSIERGLFVVKMKK